MNIKIITIAFFLLSLTACNNKVQTLALDSLPTIATQQESPGYERPCLDANNYAPDEYSEERTVRVNVHFMTNPEETANFTLEDGKTFVRHVINNANDRLGKNKKMNLPVGNTTPVLDPTFRYKVVGTKPGDDGYYYHKDEEHYYFMNKGKKKNNYKKAVIKKYAISDDTILNIFVISHPQDSLKSKSYKATGTGIALGTSLKISGFYSHRHNKPHNFGTLLNHEIGHVLGLAHSWTKYDGCDDTPVHPNCWDPNSGPPCDGTYSNNVMDYNRSQMAYTPCQLGKIHKGFNRLGSKTRPLVYDDWCKPISNRPIIITSSIDWKGDRDIRRDIIVKAGGRLDLHCRLSLAAGRKIIVEQGGELHLHSYATLHNSCGDQWGGIEVLTKKDLTKQLYIYGTPTITDVIGTSITNSSP